MRRLKQYLSPRRIDYCAVLAQLRPTIQAAAERWSGTPSNRRECQLFATALQVFPLQTPESSERALAYQRLVCTAPVKETDQVNQMHEMLLQRELDNHKLLRRGYGIDRDFIVAAWNPEKGEAESVLCCCPRIYISRCSVSSRVSP